ncbi:hypothetical protein KAU19_07755 [Candidatus Parcubacteria bacterium]|nr:hypothetical protein [Candidatus Parcubacteria bacterium]
MVSENDELGGKFFGSFAYPNGDPIIGPKEVKENHDNNKIKFFVACEISKTIGAVASLIEDCGNMAINGEPNPIISQIERVVGRDSYPQKTFEFVN